MPRTSRRQFWARCWSSITSILSGSAYNEKIVADRSYKLYREYLRRLGL